MIWLSCEAHFEHNKKQIEKIQYFPNQGFSGYFFPCRPRYPCVDPIVAILITNPNFDKNKSKYFWQK